MAHLVVDFYSDTLGMETRMHVLLPECLAEGKAKTLYLLHGMSDNEGLWMRRTSIDRYAAAKNLAVIMPDGGLGWYTDMHCGLPYFTFVAKRQRAGPAEFLGGRVRSGGGCARLGKRPACRCGGA